MILRTYSYASILLASALVTGACSSSGDSEDTSSTNNELDASAAGGNEEGSETAGGDTDGDGEGTDGADTDTGAAEEAADTDGSESSAGDGAGGEDTTGGGESTTSDLDAGASTVDPLPGIEQAVPDFVTIETTDAGTLEILCGTEPCQCSDGIDNDGDGTVDGQDGECTGPFDHDEGTFSTGIPGDNRDPNWQDCFFDGNSGAGDDGCRYHTDCMDPDNEVTNRMMCEVTDECVEYCQPLTPPGCDCFGCCEIPNNGDTVYVLVAESCSLDVLDDEAACPRCEQTDVCNNECGECELCVGKTLEDLPDHCFPPPQTDPPEGGSGSTGTPDGGTDNPDNPGGEGGSGGSSTGEPDPEPPMTDPPANVCDNGLQACIETADCAGNYICSFGCCKPLVILK